MGKKLDALLVENAALKAAKSASAPAAQQFVPKQYDEQTQDEIDESPELLLWQMSPDPEHQRLFAAAEKAHELLMLNQGFKDKPASERFAAALALVKRDVAAPSTASTPKTLEDAQRVIASATSAPAGALTVGDLRGGALAATNPTTDYGAILDKGGTDEDVIASLARYG